MKARMVFSMLTVLTALVGCHHGHHKHGGLEDEGAPGAPGGPAGPGGPVYNLPPSQMLFEPGPGVGGPGPGVFTPPPGPPGVATPMLSQIAFISPDGMVVRWSVTAPAAFDSEPLVAPGSYNFPQGAIYRLKLSNIPGRAGVELYPTLEVGPATPRTEAFLAHNKLPVQFTDEDFDQVLSGNFVTKVIYLPDEEFQELAVPGIDTLVSTRLDPGIDPIIEADRRGTILAIVRIGNKDLQLPAAGPAAEVIPSAYGQPVPGQAPPIAGQPGPGGPAYSGAPAATYGPPATVPSYISGVTSPQYGMPYVGTPIGLPGPPHLPLGGPAGLQSHSISNHTHHHIPGPTHFMDIHVRQTPGLSYPKPPNTMYVHEQVAPPPGSGPMPKGSPLQPTTVLPGNQPEPGYQQPYQRTYEQQPYQQQPYQQQPN